MSTQNNYILSKGELLTSTLTKRSGGGKKNPPYTLDEALSRVISQLNSCLNYFDDLPDLACPDGKVVAALTMHPRYISKSDFPNDLLTKARLKPIGGRSSVVKPDKWGVKDHPDESVSDTWFVSTKKSNIIEWSKNLKNWVNSSIISSQLQSVEEFTAPSVNSKIKSHQNHEHVELFEVILHSDNSFDIVENFIEFTDFTGGQVITKKIRRSGGIIFLPIETSSENIEDIAEHTFLRAIRPMPKLRTFRPPVLRSDSINVPALPEPEEITNDAKIVIFDGGIPNDSPLMPWVNYIEPPSVGDALAHGLEHGEAVTSAFLFGHMTPNQKANSPFSKVDHVRIIDTDTEKSGDFEMYDVLDRILNHLDSTETAYEYVNLSLGPDIPIDDDEVTLWTSELDKRAADGNLLITVAAGNSGESDSLSGLNRIQPPSDGVNVLSVGASNSPEDNWERASYSSVGPGRTPGIAKPDGVIFGGAFDRPFGVINTSFGPGLNGTMGTSFSAPLTMRSGIGIQGLAGHELSPLAIRALLVHNADNNDLPSEEVGWGRFISDPNEQIICSDDEVTLVYQGKLPLKEYLRATVPLPPDEQLSGIVTIKATLVIAPDVDPAFSHAYTRAGLDVVFRPNTSKFKKDSQKDYPQTDMFFSEKNLYHAAEYKLRQDGHKWEPCWRASRNKYGSSLDSPCFDIYYHNRDEGRPDTDARPLPYAFIVSLKAKREPDLYIKTLNAYSEILTPIEPRIGIPITV